MSGSTAAPSWKVEVVVPAAAGEAITATLEAHISTISLFTATGGGAVSVFRELPSPSKSM